MHEPISFAAINGSVASCFRYRRRRSPCSNSASKLLELNIDDAVRRVLSRQLLHPSSTRVPFGQPSGEAGRYLEHPAR